MIVLCKGVEYTGIMVEWSKILEKTADDWPNLPTTYESKPAELELTKGASVVVHAMVPVADKDRDTVNLGLFLTCGGTLINLSYCV